MVRIGGKPLAVGGAALFIAILLVGVRWRVGQTNGDSANESVKAPQKHDAEIQQNAPSLAASLPADMPDSNHPVERAIAAGTVLATETETSGMGGARLNRSRLARVSVQPGLVRVEEEWLYDDAGRAWNCLRRDMYLADQLIVRAQKGVDATQLGAALAPWSMRILSTIGEDLYTVRLGSADLNAAPEALRLLSGMGGYVNYAEMDGVGFGSGVPNDTSFSSQWGMHNTGQSGGAVDADVDAPEFWDIMQGAPGIVVAVLDSGLNFTHPDLQGIAWVNPGEIAGNGLDDDGSGRIDDVNGWDFVNTDNDPADDHGHGSNVTGIIAANRNNSAGVAGLTGDVKILVCKILNSSNGGSTSNLIAATTYARLRGVPIMNMSLQNYPFSSTLNTEFTACETAGILLCICAGNQGVDNDTTPNYPSSYTQTNIIAVGNHDRTDARWAGSFNPSNYGATRVDLFGPGREILSPVLGTSYSSYTGTSQATPFVTAGAAAIKYANPAWQAAQIKNSIMSSVVALPAYSGQCVTGGRFNALDALAHAVRQLPENDSDLDGFSNLFEYLAGTLMDVPSSKPEITAQTVGGFLRISGPHVARPDAHFDVETTATLSSWTTVGVTDFSTAGTVSGGIPLTPGSWGFLHITAVPSP